MTPNDNGVAPSDSRGEVRSESGESRRSRRLGVYLLVVVGLVSLLVLVTPRFVPVLFNCIYGNRIADAYAAMQAADLLHHFMARHKRWPRNWSELRETQDYLGGHATFSLDELQERVSINFDISQEEFREIGRSHGDGKRDFIRLRSGRSTDHWNEGIADGIRIVVNAATPTNSPANAKGHESN